jgi:hypothetical protein
LQKIEKRQRVVLQTATRYATSCGPGGFCNMGPRTTCAVSSDVALFIAFPNDGERDVLSLRQEV